MIIPQRFAGKTVMITGAAHGIGAATARRFLEEGARVAVIDREADGFTLNLPDAPADRLLTMVGDCTEVDVLVEFHAKTVAAFGPVDVLFNNVGQSGRERAALFHELQEEVWRFVMEVSLFSTMCMSWIVVPPCVREVDGLSTCPAMPFLSVTPVWWTMPPPSSGLSIHSCTRRELAPYWSNGQCRCTRRNSYPRSRPANASRGRSHQVNNARGLHRRAGGDVAGCVAFLASEDARYITGQTLLIDGGRWMI